ncbi:MAG: YhfC family intramembrane metalloprotease [Lachnospiraceae bacterium]|nr:YhfC family intramembrane metalloprotease [Lachnospiraceae bacterium]
MEFTKIGTEALISLWAGAVLAFVLPVAIALIWKFAKRERITTIAIGGVIFLVFALFLEKPLQSLVISVEHPLSRFLAAHPVLWSLTVGLFPGIFEETGRLLAFGVIMKGRRNRETAISYGLGHAGMEVILILGLTYATYLAYAGMINSGAFGEVVDLARAADPKQAESLITLAGQIAGLKISGIVLAFVERAFAFLFHIGASILVFYACKDAGRRWLFPLAVALHTLMDFVAGLSMTGVLRLPIAGLEAVIGVIGILTFAGAYFLLYRKDGAKTKAGA